MMKRVATTHQVYRHDKLVKLVAVSLAVVVALGLAEVLSRWLFPVPGRMKFVPDPMVGFRHAPNQKVWITNAAHEFGAWFTTNSVGDPDPERLHHKPKDVYRIAVLGDSMVEAAQVQWQDRFTSRLERQLSERMRTTPGNRQRVEVLNFGTASYGTAQEWLYYRSHVRHYSPDLVLLVLLPGNDIRNNSFELEVLESERPEIMPFFQLNEAGELMLKDRNFYLNAVAKHTKANRDAAGIGAVFRGLRKRLHLVQLLHKAYAAFLTQGQHNGQTSPQVEHQTAVTLQLFDPQLQKTSPAWQQAWSLTSAILTQLSQDVAEDGAEFHVAIASGPWEVHRESRDRALRGFDLNSTYDWDFAHQATEAMLVRLKLNYTNLVPPIQKAARERSQIMHFIGDGHYTPAGHQAVAEELLPALSPYIEPQAGICSHRLHCKRVGNTQLKGECCDG